MFTPLRSMIIAAIVMMASPVFAASVTYQISVTVPPHAMMAAAITSPEQTVTNSVPQINGQQIVQEEKITRNNQTVTVQSIVVL